MSASPRVLVTGSAGHVGRAVVRELQSQNVSVRGFDRLPTPGLADSVVGDITDGDALWRAAEGATALVHLAATPDDDDFLAQLIPNNAIGVYQVFEAARRAGVKRLVLASSVQVVWWQMLKGPWPIRAKDPITPRSWYAALKVFLEAAGRSYAEVHGLSVVAVRLGWCPRSTAQIEEMVATPWAPDLYCSAADAGRLFTRAALAPGPIKYAVVFATSKPLRQTICDLEPARELLGYEPRDSWPAGVKLP